MNTHSPSDTIVSTGQGIAAISVIRMSGAKAIEIDDKTFKEKILRDAPSHTLYFGRIEKEIGDQLVDNCRFKKLLQ